MKWQPVIAVDGTTGKLSFQQNLSANVERIAQPSIVSNGKVESVTAEELAQPLQRP